MIKSNLKLTNQRKRKVNYYLKKNVLDDKFICPFFKECKSSHRGIFYEGQLHHIGKYYDLIYNKKPFRVIVVGQEYGGKPPKVTLQKRYEGIMFAANGKRFNAVEGYPSRNPHMRGITSVLKLLFGLPFSNVYEDEFISIGKNKIHIFDSFALVNYLLCSAVTYKKDKTGKPTDKIDKKGKSTSTMKRNCKDHFRKVIDILEPNLIIVQGKSFFNWIEKSFDSTQKISKNLYKSYIDSKEMFVASFTHPSSQFPHNWGANERTPYLLNTVKPTVKDIRKLIGVTE